MSKWTRPASPPKKGRVGLKFLARQPIVTRPASLAGQNGSGWTVLPPLGLSRTGLKIEIFFDYGQKQVGFT